MNALTQLSLINSCSVATLKITIILANISLLCFWIVLCSRDKSIEIMVVITINKRRYEISRNVKLLESLMLRPLIKM